MPPGSRRSAATELTRGGGSERSLNRAVIKSTWGGRQVVGGHQREGETLGVDARAPEVCRRKSTGSDKGNWSRGGPASGRASVSRDG